MRKRLPAALATVVLLCTTMPSASAHRLSNDSVDGHEIRYEKYTAYNTVFSHGVNSWNALGKVKIASDSATTVADLEVRDAWQSSASWDGRWTPRSRADLIEFNRSFMDGYTDWQRNSISTHEFGHALGMDDLDTSAYAYEVMWHATPGRKASVPYKHDKSDYITYWG